MNKRYLATVLFVLCELQVPSIYAAPCCSGSVVAPSLITTESKAQVLARMTASQVVGRSRSDGTAIFNKSGNDDYSYVIDMAGAYAVTPRLQINGSVPVNVRYRGVSTASESHAGLGDVSIGVGYELLQELYYNPYKPRVWIYTSVSAPTGRSIYDNPSVLGASAHGRGHWSAALGAFALKTWGRWDASFGAQYGRSLPARHNVGSSSVRVSPGAVSTLSTAAGVSFGRFRTGVLVSPVWEQKTVSDLGVGEEGNKLWWVVGAQVSAVIGDTMSIIAAYNDQTILGPTYGATLNRSASLMAQYRFE